MSAAGKFSPLSRLSQLRHSKTGPCMPSGAAGLCLLSTNFTDNRSWLGDSTLANKPKLKTHTPGWQDIMTTTTNHKSTDPVPINVVSFMVQSRTFNMGGESRIRTRHAPNGKWVGLMGWSGTPGSCLFIRTSTM